MNTWTAVQSVAAVAFVCFFASLILVFRAVATRSWPLMLAAALCSLPFDVVAGFSIGPFVFLLTCLQLTSAVALRWAARWPAWLALLLVGVAAWALIVPVQLATGVRVPEETAFLFVVAVASVAIPFGPSRLQRR